MYCVKCGVKLQDGVKECPLCHTKVMYEEILNIEKENTFSNIYPVEKRNSTFVSLGILTSISISAILISLIICLNLYNRVYWSGYVMLGVTTSYILFILPLWFKKFNPYIFISSDIAALEGYLLYICLYTKGHWFLGFAFPVVLYLGITILFGFTLFHYIKKGRLFVTGGYLIFIGCSSMLIELFECITFKTKMFTWSLYPTTFFSALGIFLIIAGIIKPLRNFLEKKFFI